MNTRFQTLRRALVLLALGGSTLAVFGPVGFGCNYAQFGDYQKFFQTIGNTFIEDVADQVSFGTDWDKYVSEPLTKFSQSVWANWLDWNIPDDLPNNPIVKR